VTIYAGVARVCGRQPGGDIVKPRIVVGVVAVLSTFVLSTTGVEAGPGGFPSPLTSFFVCQAINGDVPGRTVDIQVPLLNLNLGSVKLGNGTLSCAFAQLFLPNTNIEISPNPASTFGSLKCYAISVPRKGAGGAPTLFDFTDAFGAEQNAQGGQVQYVCAPSTFTQ
jgi:hypothetical protein